MGLTYRFGQPQGEQFIPNARLALTKDKTRLVPEDSAEAAFVYCIPGRPIPLSEAKRYGLVTPQQPVEDAKPEVKESAPAETKEIVIEETKGRKRGRRSDNQ